MGRNQERPMTTSECAVSKIRIGLRRGDRGTLQAANWRQPAKPVSQQSDRFMTDVDATPEQDVLDLAQRPRAGPAQYHRNMNHRG